MKENVKEREKRRLREKAKEGRGEKDAGKHMNRSWPDIR